MKKFIPLLLLLSACCVGCTRVEPGYVGLKVNNYGLQRGVEDFPLQVGRVWYNPITTDVYKFPTFLQTEVWTKDDTDGSPNDDSITFSDKRGVPINADIAISYSVRQDSVPSLFIEFRLPVNEITSGYMRNKVREWFNNVGSKFEAINIVGEDKGQFQIDVLDGVRNELGPKGFDFDSIAMVGAPRLDANVQKSINAALDATQRAIRAENELRERVAEAEKAIADARGTAESLLINAEAEAQANRIVAESLTPSLVEYRAIEKWNGELPTYSGGGAVPFINVAPSK